VGELAAAGVDHGRDGGVGAAGLAGEHDRALVGHRAIGAAQVRKAQLEGEMAQMQANREAWAMTGMLGKLERCGPKSRPCIRVDERAGSFGDHADYRVILGY